MKFRYLIIDAEPWSTGIKDEFEGRIPVEEVGVTDSFCVEFKQWLTVYQEQSMVKDSVEPQERNAIFRRLMTRVLNLPKD